MSDRGLPEAGLAHLREVMSGHVDAGDVPGLVLGLSRGGDVHVEAIGAVAPGGAAMRPDAIFRITSMTRPVTALAALILIRNGKLSLAEPVDRLLPELAGRPVLRRLDGPVEDTVPAHRPVTVGDLLTFRAGFGIILAPPSEYPVLAAEQALELCSAGPPVPATPHDPDEWLRRMGTLPLMDQPGTQWRYATSSQILGMLVARAAGQPAEEFYAERIFGPLGMTGTAFTVPPAQLSRLVPCFQNAGGVFEPYDDQGLWARPRPFPDCGGGLAATVGDYVTFGRLLLDGGAYRGTQLVPPELVAEMTADHLTPEQRASAGPILDGRGWGFGLSIMDGGYGWGGGFGTTWFNDPARDMVAVLCTQVLAGPAGWAVESGFTSAVAAIGG